MRNEMLRKKQAAKAREEGKFTGRRMPLKARVLLVARTDIYTCQTQKPTASTVWRRIFVPKQPCSIIYKLTCSGAHANTCTQDARADGAKFTLRTFVGKKIDIITCLLVSTPPIKTSWVVVVGCGS